MTDPLLDAENEYRTLTARLAALERVAEAARGLVATDPDYEEHGVLRVDDGPFKALRAALDALPEAPTTLTTPDDPEEILP